MSIASLEQGDALPSTARGLVARLLRGAATSPGSTTADVKVHVAVNVDVDGEVNDNIDEDPRGDSPAARAGQSTTTSLWYRKRLHAWHW